jgi:acid phosphatase
MYSIQSSGFLLAVLAALSPGQLASAETVLGAYVFHRHGDRISKSTPPTLLTDLGYSEVHARGQYYNSRYIAAGSPTQISGIEPEIVKLSQLTVSAAVDNVLQNSAAGWLQGLYPPAGTAASQTLRNGTSVESPLNGFQLIPVQAINTGSASESSAWLQGASNCLNAQTSSNAYFSSASYESLLSSSADLYKSVEPAVNATFTSAQTTFKNAYTIWDLLNVAEIHNSTQAYPALNNLSNDTMHQLFLLANIHEYNLAYNATDSARAIPGAVLAGQVLEALNQTIATAGKGDAPLLNVQFGAYAGFLSYFGLAQLPAVSADFTGIPDYASSMAWELVTNASVTNGSFPTADQISVRFLFNNGTSASSDNLTAYPLFGQSNTVLPWSDFLSNTQKFAITGQSQWCQACGNSTGVCASTSSSSTSAAAASSSSSPGGISKAVAGVIGAMVTLAVVLGLEALVLLLGGLRLAKKRNAVPMGDAAVPTAEK